VSDREKLPEPAREALDEPHLDADELEREIGDSEAWDEASEDTGSDESQRCQRPDDTAGQIQLQINQVCGVSQAPD
jgi:hypothetical protein